MLFQNLPRLITVYAVLLFASLAAIASEPDEDSTKQKVDLTPHIHGTIRARWEMDTQGGENSRRMGTHSHKSIAQIPGRTVPPAIRHRLLPRSRQLYLCQPLIYRRNHEQCARRRRKTIIFIQHGRRFHADCRWGCFQSDFNFRP